MAGFFLHLDSGRSSGRKGEDNRGELHSRRFEKLEGDTNRIVCCRDLEGVRRCMGDGNIKLRWPLRYVLTASFL